MRLINPYRIGIAVAATTAILGGINAATVESAAATPGVSSPARTLPLCAVEDASSGPVPCVWVAFAQGNGTGHSFRVYRDGRFKYISDRRAYALAGDCDSDGPLYCRVGGRS